MGIKASFSGYFSLLVVRRQLKHLHDGGDGRNRPKRGENVLFLKTTAVLGHILIN